MPKITLYSIKASIIASSILLSACSGATEKKEVIGEVENLYNQGMSNLEKGRYLEAVNIFEELERQHPYSGWATRAQMMITYAHYRRAEYDEAVIAADHFIRMHPGHKDLPYLFYLKALSYYNRISDVKRDQGMTMRALEVFEELRRRFPESQYARDAKLKITLCKDHLAGKEMMVGRFYQEQQRYLAAINRYRYVIENYQTTSQTPEALYRLVESYLAIGVDDEAQIAAAVLGHNFPESTWYKDAYELFNGKELDIAVKDYQGSDYEKSWLGQIFKGIKDALD